MPEHTLILNTLRSQKILSNKLYWEFIDNMKPYFWNSIVYKYLNNNNKAYVKFIPFIVNAKKKCKLDTTIKQSTENKPTVKKETVVKKPIVTSKETVVNKPTVVVKKNKPNYKGKMPESAINNYKEWKKNQLNMDVTKSIPREVYNKCVIEDNFNKNNYTINNPWYEYIKHNMII